MSEKLEKGYLFHLKMREKGLFLEENIIDKGVAFFLLEKHENKNLLMCGQGS